MRDRFGQEHMKSEGYNDDFTGFIAQESLIFL